MSRVHFWGRAVDTYGNIKPDTGITIYLTGTETPATIYTTQTGGTGITTAPQVTTDETGRFNFWIDNDDYILTQLFDIIVDDLTYTKVDVFRLAIVGGEIYAVSAASQEFTNRAVEIATVEISAATRESDQRLHERIDILDPTGPASVSAASLEGDRRLHERIDILDPTGPASVSAASLEGDRRLYEYVFAASGSVKQIAFNYTDILRADVEPNLEEIDPLIRLHIVSGGAGGGTVHYKLGDITMGNIGSSAHAHPRYDTIDVSAVSAASREADNRVREYAETLDSPSANIINRATEYTDVTTVSLSAASREQDQRVREYAESLESPSGNIINRATEYTDVQITSVSGSSDEKDQRLIELINAVSAASLEADNQLLQVFTVSGAGGIER